MIDISTYLAENWPILTGFGLELLMLVIFAIFKKKPVVRSLEEWVLHVFEYYGPAFINAVEKKGGSGEWKKKEVMRLLMIKMNDLLDLDSHAQRNCQVYFDRLIEESLSTPQKKVSK